MPSLQHFKLVQSDIAISSGNVTLDTQLQSKGFAVTNWMQTSQLNVKNLSGSVGEQTFEALTLAAQWTGMEQWRTLQPVAIGLKKLESGLVLNDIRMQLSLPKPTPVAQPALRIDNFHAGIFNGSIDLPSAQAWDFSAPANTITLRARDWQLAEVVALQQG